MATSDVGGMRRGLKRKIRDALTEDDAMEILLDASVHEHKLCKRVRVAASLEEALGEIFETEEISTADHATSSERATQPNVEAQCSTVERCKAATPPVAEGSVEGVVSTAVSSDQAFHDDIMDLLELAECGIPVAWPRGWDIQRARSTQSQTRDS